MKLYKCSLYCINCINLKCRKDTLGEGENIQKSKKDLRLQVSSDVQSSHAFSLLFPKLCAVWSEQAIVRGVKAATASDTTDPLYLKEVVEVMRGWYFEHFSEGELGLE